MATSRALTVATAMATVGPPIFDSASIAFKGSSTPMMCARSPEPPPPTDVAKRSPPAVLAKRSLRFWSARMVHPAGPENVERYHSLSITARHRSESRTASSSA